MFVPPVDFRSVAKPDGLIQLARRIVADARHEAYLMIDEDERRVLGGQGLVGRF